MLSTIGDTPLDANSEKSKVDVTDVLGIGKAIQSLAVSFGKLIEKIPSEKFTALMAYVSVMVILYVVLIVVILYLKPLNPIFYVSVISVFFLMIIYPFIIIDFKTKKNKIDKK